MEYTLSVSTELINMMVNYSGGAIRVSLWRLIVTFWNCCDTFIRIPCEPGYPTILMTMNGVATGVIYPLQRDGIDYIKNFLFRCLQKTSKTTGENIESSWGRMREKK